MALDFPSSPTNGQVYEQYVYDSALPGWRSKGGAVAATYTSDTAPSGAVKGDMWYRTSDGTTYVYVVDGDTAQWVEIRSEISTAQVGLVPILPTTIGVSSGTATVDAKGIVSFTGAANVYLNGVFTSVYRNYRVVVNFDQAGAGDFGMRVSAGGVVNTDANYQLCGVYSTQNGTTGVWATQNANYVQANTGNAVPGSSAITCDVLQPAIAARRTVFNFQASGWSGTYRGVSAVGFHANEAAYDGFVLTNASTMTGTIKIYGYN